MPASRAPLIPQAVRGVRLKSLKWLRRAVAQGHPDAKGVLAKLGAQPH